MPNGRKIYQTAMTYSNIFHSKALQNVPRSIIRVCKCTIWQPCFQEVGNVVVRTAFTERKKEWFSPAHTSDSYLVDKAAVEAGGKREESFRGETKEQNKISDVGKVFLQTFFYRFGSVATASIKTLIYIFILTYFWTRWAIFSQFDVC
jgi:hypothetical protein